jgi:hypothetical protein
MTEQWIVADPPTAVELEAVERDAGRSIAAAAVDMHLLAGAPPRLIVVGGTGEYLVRLGPNEDDIGLTTVRGVLSRLTEMTAADLATAIAIPEARARVLPAGVAIVAAIAERVQPERIEIARSGIRAGLLRQAFGQPADDDGAVLQHGAESAIDEPSDATTFRDAMKPLIAQRWANVWKAIPVALAGTDIEGVHDVRVASRRLRAAMDVAAPAFPKRWYGPLHRAAKEITKALGEVRDRDVLLEALRADRATAPLAEQPGIDRLIARVERERATARTEMERFLRELGEGSLRSEVARRFGERTKSGDPSAPTGSDAS